MEFSRPEYWSGQPFPSPGDLPNPGIKPRSPALQADSLPAEPPGKPKNTRMSSLSLLQWIFLTQELDRGLLHCRQIHYQLNYQGSPWIIWMGPCNHKTFYKRKGGPRVTEGDVWTEAEFEVMWPRAEECGQPPNAKASGMGSPLVPPEGTQPC